MKFFNDKSIIKQSGTVPEMKLSYKSTTLTDERLIYTEDTVEFLRQVFDPGTIELQEQSIMLMLDELNRPICYYHVSSGTKDNHYRDFRLLLKILLAVNPDKFILSHNHPGPIAFPSPDDIKGAFTFKRMAEFFGFLYSDEIIISKEGHYSFTENYMMW